MTDTFALSGERAFSVSYPADLTAADVEDVSDFLAIVVKKLQRLAGCAPGEPPGKAAPPAAAPTPGATRPQPANPHLARLTQGLGSARGPLSARELAEATGLSEAFVGRLLRESPGLFEKEPESRHPALWRLTPEGRSGPETPPA